MAKSTKAQEALTGSSDSYTEEEFVDPMLGMRRPELGLIDQPPSANEKDNPEDATGPDLFPVPELDEEGSKSVGTDSSQSSPSEHKASESSKPHPLKPAHMTENPFNQPATEPDSSAASVDGDGQKGMQRQSARPRKANPSRARVRSTDEVDEFDI